MPRCFFHRPHLPHRVGQRFFAKHMLAKFHGAMVAAKWVWSGVLTTTASISLPILSSIWRKSRNRLAFGWALNESAALASSTSQRATMFSPASPWRLSAPRPPTPMHARLILLLADGPDRPIAKSRGDPGSCGDSGGGSEEVAARGRHWSHEDENVVTAVVLSGVSKSRSAAGVEIRDHATT